jgi:XTP/dITP diphosphohydrolase
MQLIFATSNEGKLREAREVLGLSISGTSLEIDEIQSLDPVSVAQKKALAYYEKLKKPIFVEDVSLTFNAFMNLPGTYINDFYKSLGNVGLIKLLEGRKDRRATAQTTIVYIDKNKKSHIFVARINGSISTKVLGTKGFGWDPIFIPSGQPKTFAQMADGEKNKYSMRAIALKQFEVWLGSSK